MQAKDHQIHELIPFLNNFKNEKFKYRVAEFIQWCCLQLGNIFRVMVYLTQSHSLNLPKFVNISPNF